jgi:lipopolysaccharide/colanic/teichoic acid biosynthesis glycosyltransferase
LVLAIFLFGRLDYNRLQFFSSFLLCAFWFFVVYFKIQRQRDLRIGVVPSGGVDVLLDIPDVEWVRLGEDAADVRYHSIVADLHSDMPPVWERFLADCAINGVNVMHLQHVVESLTGRVEAQRLSENTFGTLLPNMSYNRAKRAGDLLVCIIGLPFFLVILAAAAIALRFEGAGPMLLHQERMGFRGRPFVMFKLRTRGGQSSATDDQRLTRIPDVNDQPGGVARFLQHYGIDELPQFINILKGEMSWIGPRPEPVPLSAFYEADAPIYRYRHIVRPGITGWAQVRQGRALEVHGRRAKLEYDFYYIKNYSFWLDLLIVAGTARILFRGAKAG